MSRLKLGRYVNDNTRSALEEELHRYEDDDYLWHRHCTGVVLNPHQLVWSGHLDENHTNLLISSRRIGKSFSVASKLLKLGATKARSEINIHAPALEQSKRNLKYMIDMILNSKILLPYIEKKLGEGIGKEHIEFINGTVIQAKGQASSTDGLGATHQWWEEVDDMDLDVLYERIYPTGSMLKPGYDYGKIGQCFRIATGTIKGMGNIYTFENPKGKVKMGFHVLPKYTGWHGVRWGLIAENDLILARDVLMTPEMFARAYLCLYTESANFFPVRVVDKCQDPTLEPVDIVEYKRQTGKPHYQKDGMVTIGIDCGAQGIGQHPSEWSVNIVEDLGYGRMKWLYAERYPATANPEHVRQNICRLIEFFKVDRGYGDAFDTTLIYNLNKLCYEHRLTRRNPDDYENRQGSGGWSDWFICPVRFIGQTKHEMFKNLRLIFYQQKLIIPYVVKDTKKYKEIEKLRDQLENIKKGDSNTHGYDTYEMIRDAIGDDHVDSLALSVYAQCEMNNDVKPIGIGIDAGGFRDFSGSKFGGEPNFIDRIHSFESIRSKAPTTISEFMNRD